MIGRILAWLRGILVPVTPENESLPDEDPGHEIPDIFEDDGDETEPDD